jgi:hypothetical protein
METAGSGLVTDKRIKFGTIKVFLVDPTLDTSMVTMKAVDYVFATIGQLLQSDTVGGHKCADSFVWNTLLCWEVPTLQFVQLKRLFRNETVNHRPDDGGSTDIRNVGKLIRVRTALQPRRRPPSSNWNWPELGRVLLRLFVCVHPAPPPLQFITWNAAMDPFVPPGRPTPATAHHEQNTATSQHKTQNCEI